MDKVGFLRLPSNEWEQACSEMLLQQLARIEDLERIVDAQSKAIVSGVRALLPLRARVPSRGQPQLLRAALPVRGVLGKGRGQP